VTDSLPDLSLLLRSWKLALRAERKSPSTVKSYAEGVHAFLTWCESTPGTRLELTKGTVQAFIAALLDGGAQPKTASARLLALRRFSAWLAEEGELDADELVGLKQPKIDRKVVEALSDDQLRDLIKVCRGKRFTDRRDEAIVRLMAETGMRAGEVINMSVSDADLTRGLVVVRRGKGGQGRVVPIGPQTSSAIDRYLRTRRTHRLAATGTLWLGADDWRTFSYHALHRTLALRAEQAGIKGFHPHKMRHTAATRWLRAGGSEGGLMAVSGWSSRTMLDRYVAASAAERAADEARGLNLGDL
jgi:site-specific recombinase XerD